MTVALMRPTFRPDGAPLSVLIDFDGTISLADVGDMLLARFAPDGVEVARMDRLYDDGGVGSRELLRWDMEALPRDPELLLREAAAVALDETFLELVEVVRGAGGVVEVVSDGVGFHIEGMLARLGLADLPVATNATELGTGREGVSFPFGHPDCFVCGTCKRERVRVHQAAGRAVVFVGDGTSDRYAAHHADIVFAKAGLARYCAAQGIPYEAWDRLDDVARSVRQALANGRLPSDETAFQAWLARARPKAPSFICGPEAWGPGRTTPVPHVTHRRDDESA